MSVIRRVASQRAAVPPVACPGDAERCESLPVASPRPNPSAMGHDDRAGQIGVIFVSKRTGEDDDGYAAAADAMAVLAAQQPGYCGIESVRSADGLGITISYWRDEASARAWRDQPEHARIRELGRARWYEWYSVQVTRVERGYGWSRA